VVVVALVAGGVPAGFIVLKQRREAADRTAQKAAAQSFARAWKGGALASLTFANAPGADVAKSIQKITGGLTSAKKDAPAQVVAGPVTGDGDNVRAVKLDVSWKLAGDRVWKYETTLQLQHKGDDWLPKFEPKLVHPELVDKAELDATTQQPKRGEIIGANDEVLVTNRPAVVIGMEPSKAESIEDSAQEIASIVDVDAAAYTKRAKAAAPNAFVDAILLRKPAYDEISSRLDQVPGIVIREQATSLAPTADFARALIGRVGQATAEIVAESKGRVSAGDVTGLSGLQRSYDKELSGTPGLVVKMITDDEEGAAASENESKELFTAGAVNGKPIHITLDKKMQDAAETALLKAPNPAALVAIKVGTGEVLAVANGGPNANGYNRAFLGQYAPGSTFKVATALGLLGKGVTSSTTVPCPSTIVAGGKKFKNFEDEVLGAVPFRTDFALSCNTAFISQANKISTAELAKAAKTLGYGQPNKLGVTAYTGSVPNSGDAVSHAAAMIGQGKVLASPVTVAGASAGVGAGTWHAPRLVINPNETPAKGVDLPKGPADELKKLMRAVVTSGTGTVLRSIPGPPVYAKTGTAEFGSATPPKTHAWLTGFQGDVAFAVIVEDGDTGAGTAGPLVKRFLTSIAG
jgi:cell division protein FtsI/penicillin-binding protein 2